MGVWTILVATRATRATRGSERVRVRIPASIAGNPMGKPWRGVCGDPGGSPQAARPAPLEDEGAPQISATWPSLYCQTSSAGLFFFKKKEDILIIISMLFLVVTEKQCFCFVLYS